ncbi:MGH1-like glycoside hydrolase domain-containing protein [Sphingomonas crusticola]|uniref:MGH1-like glycoside hydrolase domain-containing protein n=1 Tax=Sphingomonas crusticola TaxID=1697973 RepID=UPI000E276CD4|nr:glycogen debranching protein [Sphingomonas crusticola]
MRRSGLLACLTAVLVLHAPARAEDGPLDTHARARAAFGDDASWYEGNVPFFEAADATLEQVYYYRLKVLRAHQRDLGAQGYITTEFLDDVGWQREPYASLNDATGFHIREARWLHDRRYANDYIDFMYEGGGNDRHFAEGIADATYARFLADGDRGFATSHLAAMRHIYNLWDDHFDFDKGLYWIEPLLDATEYTIASIDASGGTDGFRGGDAFRPSINSYMFANATAISRLAALAGDAQVAADYQARADALRAKVEASLWSPALSHFIDRYKVGDEHVRTWEPIRGRELVGYVPWSVGLPRDRPEYAASWRHLLSAQELGGKAGPRTVEPSYPYYMRQYRYDKATGLPECQWNGPSWPFQTTQTLTGMANLLNDYRQDVVTRSDYTRLLRQYASLHFHEGKLDLEEDYDPDSGKPIVGLARSHHYDHSGFVDLIVTGLVGLRPRADDVLEVNPLLPAAPDDPGYQSYFALQDVPYHGHRITVFFDADGSRYRRGRGLSVMVDGSLAANSPILTRITMPLPPKALEPVARPIDVAVQLLRSGYPRARASINADAKALHQAIDGRIWFFPEIVNGWSTKGSSGNHEWLAIDLGRAQPVHAAELAFFADGRTFLPPDQYRLQQWRAGRWVDLPVVAHPRAIGNGVTRLEWPKITTSRVRLVVRNKRGTATRLVELKLF